MADFVVPALSEPALANQPTAARLAVIIDLLSGIAGGANASTQTQAAGTGPTLLGATGAIGNILTNILVIPTTTSPGAVKIRDAVGGSDITLFAGGATSVADLKPFTIPVNDVSKVGGWYLTLGANMSAVATGKFT